MTHGVITTFEQVSLVARTSEVRSLVDPSSTLPEVTLNIFEKEDIPGNFCREKMDVVHAGLSVGWCDLITDYHGTRTHFDLITLDQDRGDTRNMNDAPPRLRPKGLGLAAYVLAIETAHSRGLPFESQDGDLSLGSNRIWEILVQRGVARVIEPPHIYKRGDVNKVIAKYRAEVR